MKLSFCIPFISLVCGSVVLSATVDVIEEPNVVFSNYVLQPSDLIQIQVFQEPDLDKEVRIEADGSIMLPLINRVKVGGSTVSEAQEEIQELYDRDFLVNPQVNLLILEYNVRKVTVLGSVTQSGSVPIPHDRPLTVVEAISLAGATRLANLAGVQVTRISGGGKKQVINLDVKKMMGEEESSDFILQDGDIINVKERLF